MFTRKTTLIILSTALVSILATLLIQNLLQQPIDPQTPTTDPPTSETPNTNTICMDYQSEDMSTLNVDLVHTMTDEYVNNQWAFINSNLGSKINGQDARSIWFDLESLKKFIYHIEKVSAKQDSTITSNRLGVRLYYATYPDKEIMGKFVDLQTTVRRRTPLSDYHNRHTLVMIPTFQNEKGDEVDFNPLDSTTYDGSLIKQEKYKKNAGSSIPNSNTQTILGLTGTPDNRGTSSKNHGMLTPPDAITTLAF